MSAPTALDGAARTMASKWVKKGRLTASDRKAMPKSEFAMPGKGEGPKGPGAGSYPIPDASHARNALSRVSANGSPEEKSKVRAAVHRKYPDIQVGGDRAKSRLYKD